MAIIIPDNYAQITVLYASADAFLSGNGATVFGVQCPGNDILACVTNVEEAWSDNVLPQMDSSITLVSVKGVTSLLSHEITVGSQGARSGAMVTPNTACLVRKQTVGRGRRRQGRMFLPGVLSTTEVNEAGVISNTRRAQLQTAMDALRLELAAGSTDMVVLHNEEGETPAPIPTPVEGLLVEARVASQRQRLR